MTVPPATPTGRSSRISRYATLQCVGWFLYGGLNALYFSGYSLPTPRAFFGNMAVAAIGLMLSHGLRAGLRSGWLKSTTAWVAALVAGIPVCAIVLAVVTALIRRAVFPTDETLGVARFAAAIAPNYFFLFSLWAACYLGFKFAERWRQSEMSRLRALAAAREAELLRLRSQFEPHFLFNTLNTISALIDESPELAREAIRHLSAMLRASLTLEANALVPLSAEWALVGDFLRLEELRFPNRLKIEHDLASEALACHVPAFSLQTLVENAVKHGEPDSAKLKRIAITAAIEENRLCIQIVNAGRLAPRSAENTGVGLKTLRERLSLLCGAAASCSLKEVAGPAVVARLEIPQR